MITCLRADGRTVSLAEIPLAQQQSGGERMLAEDVESVVVTLQGLAPLV